MRKFKTKWFAKWAKKSKIEDIALNSAISDHFDGKSTNSLGGGLHKVRVARDGQGKSGGYRTLLAYENEGHLFFIYAFAKNEKDNISKLELETYKRIGQALLSLDEKQLNTAIKESIIFEFE